MVVSPDKFRRSLGAFLAAGLLGMRAFAGPVAPPTFTPDGGAAMAPLKVTIRCATPDAAIHITLDGTEPTARDTEVDSGAVVLVDEPLTLKAKAFLSANEVSATKTATYALTPVAGFGATFVEQNVSATMATGRVGEISVTLRNIGAKPWTPESVVLVPARPRDAAVWNVAQVALKNSVPTWKTGTFGFRITAPAEPGIYHLRWQLQAVGGKAFGEATALVRVAVVPPNELANSTEATPDSNLKTAGDVRKGAASALGAKPNVLPEAVVSLKAKYKVTAGSLIDRVVSLLANSPHSFRALRERGISRTDEEFEQLLAGNPGLFRSTRIVRRDEQGRRVIPGWPGLALNLDQSKR